MSVTTTQPKVAFFANFLRGAPKIETPVRDADATEDSFLAPSLGFESFGRGGLQLDGLHRDAQWVGAWGGRC